MEDESEKLLTIARKLQEIAALEDMPFLYIDVYFLNFLMVSYTFLMAQVLPSICNPVVVLSPVPYPVSFSHSFSRDFHVFHGKHGLHGKK